MNHELMSTQAGSATPVLYCHTFGHLQCILGKGGDIMVADRLIGVWRLIYFEHLHPDGQTSYPFGFEIGGTLTYTADDAMLMTIDPVPDHASFPRQPPGTVPSTLRFAGRYEVTET